MEIAYLLQNAESKKQYYAKVSKILFLPLCYLFYILDFININQFKILLSLDDFTVKKDSKEKKLSVSKRLLPT
jgi:hypothetical protein